MVFMMWKMLDYVTPTQYIEKFYLFVNILQKRAAGAHEMLLEVVEGST